MRIQRLLLVLGLAAGVVGCNKVEARAPAPTPDLNPPAAPTRLITPVAIPEPVPDEPPSPDPPDPATPPPTTPPVTGSNAAPPTTPPPSTPPPDPRVIRTNENVQALERRATQQLGVARRTITGVSRETLGNDGRASYDDVQRLIRSAQTALDVKNYQLARELADKAVLLVRLLVRGDRPIVP